MGVNISLTMPFEPIPKLRARTYRIHGKAHTFTPYKTKEFENRVADYYAFAYVWNKTDEDCSEFGTIALRSFAGGIGRYC